MGDHICDPTASRCRVNPYEPMMARGPWPHGPIQLLGLRLGCLVASPSVDWCLGQASRVAGTLERSHPWHGHGLVPGKMVGLAKPLVHPRVHPRVGCTDFCIKDLLVVLLAGVFDVVSVPWSFFVFCVWVWVQTPCCSVLKGTLTHWCDNGALFGHLVAELFKLVTW